MDINAIKKSDFNVKIVYPHKNNIYKLSDISNINGTSKYDLLSECSVSIIINHHKPYLKALPIGSNGSKDFSYWQFSLDKKSKMENLIMGSNTITAKNNCLKTGLSTFYSTTFNLTDDKNNLLNTIYSKTDNRFGNALYNNTNYIITPENAFCCNNNTQLKDNTKFNNNTNDKESDKNNSFNKSASTKISSNNFMDLLKNNLNKLSNEKQSLQKNSETLKDYIKNDDLEQNKHDNLKNIQNIIEKIIS